MRLAPQQLAGQRDLAPVYLVIGEEPQQLTEALDLLRRRAREAGFAEREVLDPTASGFDWRHLAAAGASLSLFAERRLLELNLGGGTGIGTEGAEAMSAFCAAPPPDVLLLASCTKYDATTKKARWVRALEQAGVLVECQLPKGRALGDWVRQRLRSRGLEPGPEAVELLLDRVEGNLVAAAQEIDKLELLHGAGPLSADDVLRSVTDSARYSVYDLVDATLGGALGRSLRVLDGLRGEGGAPTMVLWALARELRPLHAMAREVAAGRRPQQVLQAHRVWASRQGLVGAALRRGGPGLWAAGLRGCARADRVIKGQERGDPWLALRELVSLLAGGPELVVR